MDMAKTLKGWRFLGAAERAEAVAALAEMEEVPAELRALWPTQDEDSDADGYVGAFRIAASEAEKAWRKPDGQTTVPMKDRGPIPEVLSALNAWNRCLNPLPVRSGGGGGGGRERKARAPQLASNARYVIDGHAMPETRNKLSSVCYQAAVKGGAKPTTEELRAYLASKGIADPFTPGWQVELPNGRVLECFDETAGAYPEAPKPEKVKPAKADKPKADKPKRGKADKPTQPTVEAYNAVREAYKAGEEVSDDLYEAAMAYARRTKKSRPKRVEATVAA